MLGSDAVGLKKTISVTTIIFTLLFSATAVTPYVRFAFAQTEFVAIRADGSVSPSTAPIQRVGDLYVLTGDVGQISVQRSNMTLDRNGHTLQGKVWFIDAFGNNVTANNSGGIFLTKVENVTVKNFVLEGCEIGVSLNRVSNVTVMSNIITGTTRPLPSESRAGVFVWGGDHNIIVGNHFENNYYGIYLGYGVEHCAVSGNNITGNSNGMVLWDSPNNAIYHNNFANNTVHFYDTGDTPSFNAWDNGKEGNFWSDYNGTDADSDGIGDAPYKVDANNQDRYPLMKQWNPTKPVDTTPPRISITSPKNILYNDSSVPLTLSTNEPTSRISYSLNGQNNVTVDGNTTLNDLPNGSHNLAAYATDEFGNTGVSETVYFSVEVPFPTTLVAAASGAAAAVIGVGLLIYFKKRKH